MVGIIPHNEDPKQQIDSEDDSFWLRVKKWEQKGWAIALHGYNHFYTSEMGLKGLNPMWKKSEFAGLPLEEQKEKIRKGVTIMRDHGISPEYFFAPSHTFDENTLNALREESSIRIISDTIATRPYLYKDFIFMPQFSGQCRVIRLDGWFTFCFHPNTMKDDTFKQTEDFLKKYSEQFTSFEALPLSKVKKKSLFDRLFSISYFAFRRMRGLA